MAKWKQTRGGLYVRVGSTAALWRGVVPIASMGCKLLGTEKKNLPSSLTQGWPAGWGSTTDATGKLARSLR